ncbi:MULTISPECIES: XRE family transcriptional regulator [Actinosynnema]|uniref:nSTAND1 domain-containing NTPase n=1 Tax=Actinosynnema TaxID=40566 RepID=UPI0027E325F0|nr:XRE family transcriptional regulator [Actinosynnema pretiosum]MCP2095777.1 WD-40 repeat-containing protein [Actinosynnema pretiosum]
MPRGERPLDVGDTPLLKFAADLRSLRDRAGGHSYRQLGAKAHYSATTLSDAAGGRKLPSLAVTLAYVRACEGDVAAWEDRWHEVAAAVAPEEPPPVEQHPPYAGLAAFQTRDSEWFFGRDQLLDDLLSRVASAPFTALFGASGAGKSSLLQAGLVARFTGSTLLTTPSASGLALPEATADLVIIDQFEEVFTLCSDTARRAAFIAELLDAPQHVVISVRADFYGHCAQHPDLVAALEDNQLLIGPMGTEELRQAIMQPAVKASCTVETALVSRLVADATGQPGVLPLLSHALLETWRRRRGATLTLAGYEAAGGVQYAIAQTAERTYTSLERQQRELARQVFLRLTALGDGTEDTKRSLPRAELDDDVDVDVVLDRLAHARLLTLDRDRVEIAHEALIRSWPRLRGWLAEDREGLRTLRQLTEAAATWISLHRAPDALYRGTRLDTALEWTRRPRARTSAREREFLAASSQARDRERRLAHRQTRRLRQLVALLAVLLLLAGGAMVQTIRAQEAATEQRNIALARFAANESLGKRESDPLVADQLVIAAHRLSGTDDLRDAVLGAHAGKSGSTVSRSVRTSPALSPDGRPLPSARVGEPVDDAIYPRIGTLTTPVDAVTSFAVTSAAQAFATTLESPGARLWDATDARHPVAAHTFDGQVTQLSYAPNGKLLALVREAMAVELWDAADPAEPRLIGVLPDHPRWVTALAFSRDSRVLATTDNQSRVRLWDVADPTAPRQTAQLSDGEDVSVVALAPDRRTVALGGVSGAVRLWDVSAPEGPRRIAELDGHRQPVRALGFRHDSTALATVGRDDTVRLWDLADASRPRAAGRISGSSEGVYGVSFGETWGEVVTARADGTFRHWEFDLDHVVEQLCASVREPISREEWSRYFDSLEYRPPCG